MHLSAFGPPLVTLQTSFINAPKELFVHEFHSGGGGVNFGFMNYRRERAGLNYDKLLNYTEFSGKWEP